MKTNEIRLVFTGIGRRIELVQAFRSASAALRMPLKIYGADMAGTAPALAYCDHTRRICPMNAPEYIDELIALCINDDIDILIPTIDTDLEILSQNTARFEEIGTRVLISDPDKIKLCRDKNCISGFFTECGLKAPVPVNDYKKYGMSFPAFIKPKDGSSSINAYKAADEKELEMYAGMIDDYIVQPFIDGTEYTIDIMCDFEGKPLSIIPRERIAVRAGEVLKTKIFMDKRMISESESIIRHFKPIGPITVQLIRQKDTGEDYFIEINPRYGGGAPLSMKAGARSAEAVLKLVAGEKPERFDDISDGAIYSRFDQSVCIKGGEKKERLAGIIFDLDDTLYSEKQYVKSGYNKIAEYLGDRALSDKLFEYFKEGQPAIDMLLSEMSMEDKKAKCLDIYRRHKPDISLYDGVCEMLKGLKEKGMRLGIITDGRPEGQQNKLSALGLVDIIDDIIITDELGGVQFRKPNDISFRIMQTRWGVPFENIAYIGDNSDKDFIAPGILGMRSVYFDNKDSIYYKENIIYEETIYNITDVMKLEGIAN